jgi:glucose-6-phosphate isomerase, archaeal
MISLPNSGLPLFLKEDSGKLQLDPTLTSEKPKTRFLSESIPYYDTKNPMNADLPLYFMYRDVKRISDESNILKSFFRYDITVILPGQIEDEPIKTIGHVHPLSKQNNAPYTYTEVYSVIYGTAHYILQKYTPDFSNIIDIVDITVNAGEHVFIPSFYGHVTINVTNQPLVMANILYRDFSSNYEPYLRNRGAAIYLKKDQYGKIQTVLNSHYKNLPPDKKAKSSDFFAPELNQEKPLYGQWVNHLNDFIYLYQEK